MSNSVKGFFAGGDNPSGKSNIIDSLIINTGGTALDFGDLLLPTTKTAGNSNAHGGLNDGYMGTRPLPFNEAGGDFGLYGGGNPTYLSETFYIQISSTGNAADFGTLSSGRFGIAGASSKTRYIVCRW